MRVLFILSLVSSFVFTQAFNLPGHLSSSFLSQPSFTSSRSKANVKPVSPFLYSDSKGSTTKLSATGFEGLNAAIRARENCPPQICLENLLINTIRDANIDPLIVKYGHPAMMFVMLASMGGYGVYLGYQIIRNWY